MCGCMYVTRMSLPSRVKIGERAIAGRRTDKERWRYPSAGHTHTHTRTHACTHARSLARTHTHTHTHGKQITVLHCDLINQCLELISGRRNLQRDSRHWPKCLVLVIYVTHNVVHETGIFLAWFRRPDCNVIAEQGGGPDARPSWAGSGPRAGGCPPMA